MLHCNCSFNICDASFISFNEGRMKEEREKCGIEESADILLHANQRKFNIWRFCV
jgi:hypothetical protein